MRLFILCMLAVICLALNSMLDVVVHPSLSADVAVEQFSDDESAAVLMRSYDHFTALFPMVSWGFVALFGLFLFRTDLVNGAKSVINQCGD